MKRSRYVLLGLVTAVFCVWLPPEQAAAIVRSWDGGPSGNWISASNWNPDGVPASADDVSIGAHPSAHEASVIFGLFPPYTDTIGSLELSNGADLDLNEGRLVVNGHTLVGGGFSGNPPTELIVRPVLDLDTDALDTNTLAVGIGGQLTMRGGSLSVDGGAGTGLLEIVNGGAIVGEGGIHLDDVGLAGATSLIVNDGTITARSMAVVIGEPPAATLRILANESEPIGVDLDGENGTGRVTISRNATLELQTTVTTLMRGNTTMFANATLDANAPFTLIAEEGEVANLHINSGATQTFVPLPAAPAVIRGTSFRLRENSRIWLDQADEALRFEGEFRGEGGRIINSGTIYFAAEAAIGSSTTFDTDGAGRIVNEVGNLLVLGGGGDYDTPVTNHGTLMFTGPLHTGEVQIDSYLQSSIGTLAIKLSDVIPGEYDVLTVEGNALLDGTLAVSLLDGFVPVLGNTFTILETVFGNRSGEFETISVPTFDDLTFEVSYTPTSVLLEVVEIILPGDYNDDGVVDAADFTEWRDNLGAVAGTLPNDADGGAIGQAQYDTWKDNFGASGPGSGASSELQSTSAAPEPASFMLIASMVGLVSGLVRCRCRSMRTAQSAERG